MSFEMMLWKVVGTKLQPIVLSALDQEQRLEDWIAADPSILGMELAIIGRQVHTAYGGVIDLLALDPDGNCVALELKRGRPPLPLRAPRAAENRDSPTDSEWAVGVRWFKTFTRDDAKTFKGVF